MRISSFVGRLAMSAAIGLFTSACVHVAQAQVIIAHDPVIGSSNTVSADPRVSRPTGAHCSVDLFSNLEFADFNTKNFTYTPPADCPGPWSKVVFAADFTVTKGRQFDRTAQFYLGGANIYFGTTAEPRAALSPYWHVENDITDLSALLKAPQAGTALLGNFVGVSGGVTYNGLIYSSAHLVFFPVSQDQPAPTAPDIIIGIPGNGGSVALNTTASQLLQSVTLPTNVEAAYLDVIAQSQSGDEFWYLCVPDSLAGPLQSCPSTGFRETEVSIDGIPAGVAPIYPWIYTGGIDPYLWEPIPGVQTLNFKPFRVDLSPFAGLLSNGKSHTVGISVFNADSYFSVAGNLLVYTDKGSTQVTGSIVADDLAAEPTPTVINKIATDASGNVTGYVTVASNRSFTIEGKNHTSHGDVTSRVDGILNFSNTQNFDITIDGKVYTQHLVQSTQGGIATTTQADGKQRVDGQIIDYPFSFNYDQFQNPDASYTITSTSDQKLYTAVKPFEPDQKAEKFVGEFDDHRIPYVYGIGDEVASQDTRQYDANFNSLGHSGHSSQVYVQADTTGACYSRSLTSLNSALTSVTDGATCQQLDSYLQSILATMK